MQDWTVLAHLIACFYLCRLSQPGFPEAKYSADKLANGANMISLTVSKLFPVGPSCQCKLRSLFDGWQERVWSRFALQRLSERDLVDMRLTRLDVFEEAQKPFWQE